MLSDNEEEVKRGEPDSLSGQKPSTLDGTGDLRTFFIVLHRALKMIVVWLETWLASHH